VLRDMGFLVVDIPQDEDEYADETRPRRVNPYAT